MQTQYTNKSNQRQEWRPFKNSPGRNTDIDAHVKTLRKLRQQATGGVVTAKKGDTYP